MVAEKGAEVLAAEWQWAALEASSTQAGPSGATMERAGQTTSQVEQGPGIIILEKNCMCCVQETLCLWELNSHAWSCWLCGQLKKPCRWLGTPMAEGKQKVEGEREPSKRGRGGVEEMDGVEWRGEEDRVDQMDVGVAETLWAIDVGLYRNVRSI